MATLNVEIKARCSDTGFVRDYLLLAKARFAGTDLQTDTYFNVSKGRLKLREGNIENNLIFYTRDNQSGPKQSDFRLVAVPDPQALREALTLSCGIKTVVRKSRQIYYLANVKFHIDEVEQLGSFMEIEAFNNDGQLSVARLEEQCSFYMNELRVTGADLLDRSYSDMLLEL